MQAKFLPLTAALALSASAAWAQNFTLLPDPTVPGRYSATFEEGHSSAGTFADTFTFASPVAGFFSFALDSLQPVGTAGVYFQGYELNGASPTFFDNTPSRVSIGRLPIVAGPQSLLIGGVAAPALRPRTEVSAGYTATLTVDAASPIPEPQTWLLIAGGLLAVGAVAQRRRGAAVPRA
jgi:hypothetical protein